MNNPIIGVFDGIRALCIEGARGLIVEPVRDFIIGIKLGGAVTEWIRTEGSND